MIEDQFEVEVIPELRMYPKSHEEYNDYGIFAVRVESTERWDLIEKNAFTNIVIKGGMPDLKIGKRYIAIVKKVKDKKGLSYQVINGLIYMKMFGTRDEQEAFLQTVLSEFQAKKIIKAYPTGNLIELIKENKIDLDLIKGIGEKTFEKIKEKIAESEKYQRAIIELTVEFGIPYRAIKKLSDKYGSPDLLISKINKNPYILTEVDGFGFKKVDEIALNIGVEKDSPHRIVSCAEYILSEEANNGHSWMKFTTLINESIKLLGLSIGKVEEVLLVDEKSRQFKVDEKEKIIYLKRYYYYEEQIKGNVIRLLKSDFNHKVNDIEKIISSIESNQGFAFTDEQKQAIYYAIQYNILIVSGKAGTGKTSVIKGIVEALKTIDGLEYATCALSGKASQRIQESTGLKSYTIHRLYGYHPKSGWLFDEENRLPRDIIILDEASMVNSELFYYVIRAIEDGAKIIITGDTAQLEPIGSGNVLVDLITSGVVPKVELTIVHRQAQKSGILSCANLVRVGDKFLSNNDYGHHKLGELKDLWTYAYDDGKEVFKRVMAIAKKYTGDILDFQIIVPMKTRGENCAKKLNEACQKLFNQNPDEVDGKRKIDKKNVCFLEGDKVIINGNNYEKGVFNGTIGIIKYIDTTFNANGEVVGEIVIDFEGVGDIRFTKSEMSTLDLAYAITVHKSQGSQWKYVVFALDYSSYVLLNRQLTYTAMTRAIKSLFLVCELKALQHSIKTNRSVKRQTFLEKMLTEKNLSQKQFTETE